MIREIKVAGASKRQLTPEQQRILDLEKEVKQLSEANDILKNACVLSDRRSNFEKYSVIADLTMNKKVTISSACRCLAVSAAGYYAWRKRRVDNAQKYKDLKAVY